MAHIKWVNLILILILYTVSIYAVYDLIFFASEKLYTTLWLVFYAIFSGFGVTAGVHRYWCHKSYKATIPFRIFLAIAFTSSGQNSIYNWVRDHRVHHKFSDTDADPHNISRGFLFSHVGWLCIKKHKDVITQGNKISMQDVLDEPVAAFFIKYFMPLKIFLCFVLPVIIPVVFWKENIMSAILSQAFLRYCLILNATWSVNSFAHLYGDKPYNPEIYPSQNKWVSLVSLGEGWHNYHHVFPYDYKTSEFFGYGLNLTTLLLDTMAKIGVVYDLKEPSEKLVMNTMKKIK